MCKIGAVILAAGISKRMGCPKLLMPLHGKPLITYPIKCAATANLTPIVVVAGQHIQQIKSVTNDMPEIQYVWNENYAKGMSSSLKAGIHCINGQVDAAFIFLGDQPFVPPEVIHALIKEYKSYRAKEIRIVRPEYKDTPGHPVLIDAKLFPAFLSITGDQGGKQIIKRHKETLRSVTFNQPLWGMDIDTESDFHHLKALWKGGEIC